MPDKFSKIYQMPDKPHLFIYLYFTYQKKKKKKSQITEVVKDAIRFQLLSKMRDLQVLVSIQFIK